MALTCNNCGAKVELSDEYRRQFSGKFFACPECGDRKRLPIIKDEPKPVTLSHRSEWWRGLSWPKRGMTLATAIWAFCWLLSFLTGLFAPLPSSRLTAIGNAVSCAISASINTLPLYLPIVSMLGMITWWKSRTDLPLPKKGMLVATACWPVLGMLLATVITRSSFADYRPAGSDYLWVPKSPTQSVVTVDAAWNHCVGEGIVNGSIIATAIYASVMFALFVVWFATRKDSKS